MKKRLSLLLATFFALASVFCGASLAEPAEPSQLPSELPLPRTQSRASAFVYGYALTGNGAEDMVAVALAQEGRTGAEFGYTENWCADFVGDCAIVAGLGDAIPLYGGVEGLKNRIIAAGGTDSTASPLPGDICFIDWDCAGGYDHVEVIYRVSGDKVYSIGGNSGSAPNLYARKVRTHAPLNEGSNENCITCIVRPNYRENSFSFVEKCTRYPCFADVTASPNAELWTLPSRTDPESQNPISCSAEGETLEATALFKNPEGEFWYMVQKDGETYYLFAADTTAQSLKTDSTASGISVPNAHTPGSSYSLNGTLSSDFTLLSKVSCYIYSGTDMSAAPVTGTEVEANTGCYYLHLSPIDHGTVFGSLAQGRYTIVFAGESRNCYSTDGASVETEVLACETLFVRHFTVGNVPAVPGDADGNGYVSLSDAVLTLRLAMGVEAAIPNPDDADADGNGVVDMVDAIIIMRASMGLIGL